MTVKGIKLHYIFSCISAPVRPIILSSQTGYFRIGTYLLVFSLTVKGNFCCFRRGRHLKRQGTGEQTFSVLQLVPQLIPLPCPSNFCNVATETNYAHTKK